MMTQLGAISVPRDVARCGCVALLLMTAGASSNGLADVARIAPVPATPPPITDAHAVEFARLPKDEQGRVIGGTVFPLLNYSPTLITGKPCPRVTQWQVAVVKMPPPLRDFGVVQDPCVVQNAVDDLVRTLYFMPAYQTPETMREVDAVYDTDPMNVNGVTDLLRRSMIQPYRQGRGIYQRCNKPVYRLLNVDAKALLPANPAGLITGTTMQIVVLKVAKGQGGVAQGVEPFECQFVSYKDGSVIRTARVTADDTTFATLRYDLRWNARTRTWMVDSFDGFRMDDYGEAVSALLAMSPVRP